VKTSSLKNPSGFTLVELVIGMTLSLMVMGAVLSSYVFLGRNFTRSLGLTSANEPTLEEQGRRTLSALSRDIQTAVDVSTTGIAPDLLPNASVMTLILPSNTEKRRITYYYNSSNTEVYFSTYPIASNCLVRIDQSRGTSEILHAHLLSFYFRYFDSSGHPYDNSTAPFATGTDYLSGIKQIAVNFTTQGGNAANGTQTQIYSNSSPRWILRNKQLLP